MQLFKKTEIEKYRKDQTRELSAKNDRLVVSLRKILKLQNDIDFDADKAKKVKDYQIWCEDLQAKMDKELRNLKAYEKLRDDVKEEYYNLVARKDELEDSILDRREELGRIDLQLNFKRELLAKQ